MGRNRVKKVYETGLWGLSLKAKERLDEKFGDGLTFGIMITLKVINGVNRIIYYGEKFMVGFKSGTSVDVEI